MGAALAVIRVKSHEGMSLDPAGKHDHRSAGQARCATHSWPAQVTACHTTDGGADGRGGLQSPAGQARSDPRQPQALGPMISIATNILLRLWLNDDAAQNKRIDALLAQHGGKPGSLLVTGVVLAEAVWTLRSAFDQDKAAHLIAIRSLLDEIAFAFEEREAVKRAAEMFEQGNCDFTATFDRGMRKLPGVRVL